MLHAKALRIIGQTLDAARVTRFKLEKRTDGYRLWIGPKHMFSFTPADISRLDAQAQKRRRAIATNAQRPATTLSQQLRSLGSYLDRIDATGFGIVWTETNVVLNYERDGEERYYRAFTTQELRQLGDNSSRQRSRNYIFLGIDS